MGALFLAFLVFGAGALGLQLFSGNDGDANGHDVDASADADHGDVGDAHGHGHASAGFLPIFLSLRFYSFGAFAFGLVGTLLHFFKLAVPGLTLALAVLMGLGSGLLASWSFRALSRSETSSGMHGTEAVGQTARVLVPLKRGDRGKVRVQLKGQLIDMLATTDETELETGDTVLIEEVRGHVAHVSKAPREFLPPKA